MTDPPALASVPATPAPSGFDVSGPQILRDGVPHQVISGALHYFRVPHALWEDRLRRLTAMGCTTVETYVAWNFHQPFADQPADFSGDRDLGAFLDLAARLDLDVLVRPGPYICAEWDLGGLPSWLLADQRAAVAMRTSDPAWTDHVDAWFDTLIPIVARRQVSRGGRVVAVQVENEYGSYGNDSTYLEHVRDGLVERGIDVTLFTSDGPGQLWLAGGTVDDVWATVNFGSRQEESFAELETVRPGRPQMCMEFWNGWFDHWGTGHHVRSAESAAAELEAMLAGGRSVNFYMAHGGTSFGVWSGANTGGADGTDYLPTVTSYDYDAPIAEDGTLTPKFWAFREVVAAHTGAILPEPPVAAARQAPQDVAVTDHVTLDAVLDAQPVITSPSPESFETLGIHHGVVRYRTQVAGPYDAATLHVRGLADLATIRVNGETRARLGRTLIDPAFTDAAVSHPAFTDRATVRLATDNVVDLIVSSLGRVNFGPGLRDPKGITALRLDFQHQFGFDQSALDLTALPVLAWSGADPTADRQGFHRGSVDVASPLDAWIGLPGWHHGYVFLNGFNLGRYWDGVGSARTLYAPAPLWRAGANEIVVCELGARTGTTVAILDAPDLGPIVDTTSA